MGTEHEGSFWGSTNHTYVGMLYLGVTTWVCLSLLTARLKLDPVDRVRVRALLIASLITAYFATNFPWAYLVHKLPVINGSRPAYFIAFTTLALPWCAAYALQVWTDRGCSIRSLTVPAIVSASVALLIAAAVAAAPYFSFEYIALVDKGQLIGDYVALQCGIGALLLIGTFSVLAICARYPGRAGLAVWLLCVLAVMDQAIASHNLIATTPRRYVVPATKVTDFFLAQKQPCRIRFDSAGTKPGYPALYGIEEFGGYDAVYPIRIKQYYDGLNLAPGTMGDAMLSCDYGLFPESATLPEGYVEVSQMEGLIIAKNTKSVPRVRLVNRIVPLQSTADLFATMKRDDFDPRAAVYTDVPVDFSLPASDGSAPGDTTITVWKSDTVVVEADAQKESVLVLAEGYYPGWEVTVDGAPASVFPAYHLYRGVHLSPGKHTVEFNYRPASYRYGLMISFAALGLSLIGAFYAMRRPRPMHGSAQ